MNPELKKAMDDLNAAFASFRASNDERIKTLEAKGTVDPLLLAKVDASNTAITALTAQVQELQRQAREAETANARLAPAGSPEARQLEARHMQQFFSMVRGQNVEHVTEDDARTYRAYGKALEMYMRKGEGALPNELRAALQTGSMPDGGYLVRPDTSGRIIQKIYETSPMRALAAQQTIGTDTFKGMNDLEEGSAGWVGEHTTRSETGTPTLGEWEITMRELYAMPKASQKMLDDAEVNVEAWLEGKTASKMSRLENTSFVSGDGVMRPRGFLTYPSGTSWKQVEQINTGASGAFVAAPNSGDVFLTVMQKLKRDLRTGAKWAMNSTTLAAVRKLKNSDGDYLLTPNFAENPLGRLLGFDIEELADMPDIAADSLSIAFANWSESYQIIDHAVGTRLLRDPFTAKPYVLFYTTKRTGGDLVNFESIKLMKFAA